MQNEKDILFTAREMLMGEHSCSCRRVRPQAVIRGRFAVVSCQCGFVTSFEVSTVVAVQRRAASNDNDHLVDVVMKILEPPQRPAVPERTSRFSRAV